MLDEDDVQPVQETTAKSEANEQPYSMHVVTYLPNYPISTPEQGDVPIFSTIIYQTMKGRLSLDMTAMTTPMKL